MTRLLILNSQIETLSQQEVSMRDEVKNLEKKVVMMRPGSLDKDLLEERARDTLGYVGSEEFTVLSN